MLYPKFIANDQFFNLDDSVSEMKQLVNIADNLKRLHNLTTQHFDSFEKLISQYLQSGLEIFQLETGIVSNINSQQQYIVKDVVSPLDAIQQGDIYSLEDTYCMQVYKTREVVGFPEIGNHDDMKAHPVYQNLKLEAYLSAPIFVRGELYGTLNFTSQKPRKHGFSEHERDLIGMMANSIGNFILIQDKERNLITANDRLKVLVGHLAHDLRNPLGIIDNLAYMAVNFNPAEREKLKLLTGIRKNAQRSLELVSSVLDVAALGTGKLVIDKKPFNLLNLINDCLDNYEVLAHEREISVDKKVADSIMVSGDEARLAQVFHNIFSNAFKFSVQGGTIIVTANEIEADSNQVRISISNAVSPNNESDKNVDNLLYKSIGFGMDIIREVLTLHSAELQIEKESDLFSVSFELSKVDNNK